MKLAFAGFRHGHVMGLWEHAGKNPQVQVVAACEEDAATRDKLSGKVRFTHTNYAAMLREVDCDAVAIGDVFARRGPMAIAALEAGKHVLADKPMCTRLEELERIEKLAREKKRVVGCLLDLRDNGVYRAMRRIVREGGIGEVHTVTFSAQHPLLWGQRPAWYFEPGQHGGTINDIAIHALDLIPWLTGQRIAAVTAARAWNARLPQAKHFQDAGQLMLRLENQGGVLGDVSYLSPDGLGYKAEQYWRVTLHGSDGLIEGRYGGETLHWAAKGDPAPRTVSKDADRPGGVLADFLSDVAGEPSDGTLRSADVFEASRWALKAQRVADSAIQ